MKEFTTKLSCLLDRAVVRRERGGWFARMWKWMLEFYIFGKVER